MPATAGSARVHSSSGLGDAGVASRSQRLRRRADVGLGSVDADAFAEGIEKLRLRGENTTEEERRFASNGGRA
jgi:hypothetical protein